MKQKRPIENRIEKTSQRYTKSAVCVIAVLYVVLVLFCFLKPADDYSTSERRKLAQMPVFSWETLVSGSYRKDLEKSVTDQFPMRDGFRMLKSYFSLGVMGKKDTNEIYFKDGYLCEMEYPMDDKSILRAALLFEKIYRENIEGTQAEAYLAVVPDKNYFLTDESRLTMDYDAFYESIYTKMPMLKKIEIKDRLELNDYYRTDTHWKQDCLIDVAGQLADSMEVPYKGKYRIEEVNEPFYGVYYGQAALRVRPDTIAYCISDLSQSCRVFDHENNKEIPLYNMEKTTGRDPYEMFMGGNVSLVTIENPDALSKKELVVFGDSFSRSLLPLLAESYQKITLYDIRYLPSSYISKYITIADQDVLFLYSTSVLNNSVTLK